MGQGRWIAVALVGISLFAHCASAPPPKPLPVVKKLDPPPVDRATLSREGLAALEQKNYDDAIAKLTEAARQYPEVAPFLRLRIIDATIARGNAQNAAAIASDIIALTDSTAATVARLRLPGILAQIEQRPEGAPEARATRTDAAFEQAMLVPIDELTEEGFVDLANALAKAGRDDLATKTRMHLLNDYPQGRFIEPVYAAVRAEIEKLSNEDQLALAQKLSRFDHYDQSLEILTRLGDLDDAFNARIRALFNSRHYTELLEATEGKTLDPSLAMLRARAAWRDDKPDVFLAGLDQLSSAEANVLRAKYYTTDEVDYAQAIDNLTKAIDAGALGNDGENLWTLGFTYVLAGKDVEALRTFDRYIAAYPDGDYKTNSLFWSAKVLDRAGEATARDAKARQTVDEYPYSYYAYRAKELWNVAASGAAANAFPNIEMPQNDVVRALLDIGLARDATREMKVIAANDPENPALQFMLADVYLRGGEPLKANGVLQRRFRNFVRHGGANIPKRFWEILYPLPYWDVIRAEADKRGLDPYLIASIIRQESAFEPSTISNASAVGLMQIMPEEANRIAQAAGLSEVTREALFDPATNIAVGAAEYSQKLATMNGNHILAIAAYNAGEDVVQSWVAHTPMDDPDLFIESIPFAETKLYVKTVSRNRNEYRRIYGQ